MAFAIISKMGTLELGASRQAGHHAEPLITGSWQGSGLLINSDDSGSGGPKMINTIYLGDDTHIDTAGDVFQ